MKTIGAYSEFAAVDKSDSTICKVGKVVVSHIEYITEKVVNIGSERFYVVRLTSGMNAYVLESEFNESLT
jgi:hypothetical protein